MSEVDEALQVAQRALEEAKRWKAEADKANIERINAQSYAEQLRQRVEELSRELADFRQRARQRVDADTQTESTQSYAYWSGDSANAATDSQASAEGLTAESIAQIAQTELNRTGVMFDEASGMYYDWATGYYYDPKSQMYYYPSTRAYYRYDRSRGEYIFHAYADASATHPTATPGEKGVGGEKEDGEVDGTEGNGAENLCIRFVVKTSQSLPEGSVHVIGQEGGTMGRDKDRGHMVRIATVEASKSHAHVSYQPATDTFVIRDLGSKNGTFVDGSRLEPGQVEGEGTALPHGCTLELGKTVFSVHVHKGDEFCPECAQPMEQEALKRYLEERSKHSVLQNGSTIVAAPVINPPKPPPVVLTTAEAKALKERARRKELNDMKRMYGLHKPPDKEDPGPQSDGPYADRAAERRAQFPGGDMSDTFNFDKPVESATVDTPIPEDNLGSKLLRKMGWEGGGLGKEGTGRVQPVAASARPDKLGLGAAVVASRTKRTRLD